MNLRAGVETSQGLKAELVGYTSIKNIKPGTSPEYSLSKIINQDTSLTINKFIQF